MFWAQQDQQCHLVTCPRVLKGNENACQLTSANANPKPTVTLTLNCNLNIKILDKGHGTQVIFSNPANPNHRFKSRLTIAVS